MELSPDEQRTIQLYDEWVRAGDLTNHPLWVDGFSYPIFRSMPGDGEVVDVGCGVGRALSITQGLGIEKYFGIDPSTESIRFCRKNFPKYEFEVSDVRLLGEQYPDRFSGFLMLTTLMHLPRPELSRALSSLRKSLKVGAPGMLSLQFGPIGEEGLLEVVNDYGMKLTLFTFEETEQSLEENGFRVETLFTPDDSMLLGRVTAI